jgi:hypothetical protein
MSEPVIIGLSGKKQSGKNTVCDAIEVWITCGYAPNNERVRVYSFADTLKRKVCMEVLGLSEAQCYGTDEEKNSPTKYKWEDMPHGIRYWGEGGATAFLSISMREEGYMTAREIMQVVGTNIFRNFFDDNIWVDATLRNIFKDNFCKENIALISDVRFPSEVNAILENDGYVIRLTRDVCEGDLHPSETALDDYNFSDKENVCIIDNKNMSIIEQDSIATDYVKKILEKK